MIASYRIATIEDKEEWSKLRANLWPDCPPDRHRLEIEQLVAGSGVVVVAVLNRKIIGFAEVSIRRDHVEGTSIAPVPYLEGWYVLEDFRGRGIGRGLLHFVETWSLLHGFTELASDAELDNLASIRLHGMLGFHEAGKSVHFVKKLSSKG